MNSEKRFFLAAALSFLVLIFYPVYLNWVSPQPARVSAPAGSSGQAVAPGTAASITPSEIRRPETPPNETIYPFSNRHFDMEFSNIGAAVVKLHAKNWNKRSSGDALLVERIGNQGSAFFAGLANQGIDFEHRAFSLEVMDPERGEIIFSTEEAGRWRFRKIFRFDPDQSAFTMEIEAHNLSAQELPAALEAGSALTASAEEVRRHVSITSFASLPGKLATAASSAAMKKPNVVEGNIEWHALAKKYFGIFMRPDVPAALVTSTAAGKEAQTMDCVLKFTPETVPPGGVFRRRFFIYAGPKYYSQLKALQSGFEQVLSSGFFGVFKLWLLLSLGWAHRLVNNYGWAILIVTAAIKLLFTPFTHMSFESMKKMQQVQPKITALQERHKGDPQRLSRETMELYKKYKINPLGGCLPMLLQIPVFIAFYQVLDDTVELKGEPFIFWIRDLSAHDRALTLPFTIPFLGDAVNILPLLMMGSMVWQQRLTPQSGPPEQRQVMMIMPVMFGFMFYALPSGLVLYWFVSNMLGIFHQLFVKGKALPHHEE